MCYYDQAAVTGGHTLPLHEFSVRIFEWWLYTLPEVKVTELKRFKKTTKIFTVDNFVSNSNVGSSSISVE